MTDSVPKESVSVNHDQMAHCLATAIETLQAAASHWSVNLDKGLAELSGAESVALLRELERLREYEWMYTELQK